MREAFVSLSRVVGRGQSESGLARKDGRHSVKQSVDCSVPRHACTLSMAIRVMQRVQSAGTSLIGVLEGLRQASMSLGH
jgi:hypothetical protein